MTIQHRCLGYRAVQVDRFIRLFNVQAGRPPSYSEIMLGMGIGSKGEVRKLIVSLERRGLLERVGTGREQRISLRDMAA